jgi:hypothetical protein
MTKPPAAPAAGPHRSAGPAASAASPSAATTPVPASSSLAVSTNAKANTGSRTAIGGGEDGGAPVLGLQREDAPSQSAADGGAADRQVEGNLVRHGPS